MVSLGCALAFALAVSEVPGPPQVAAAPRPKIVVLSTEFVLARKFQRMQDTARLQDVELVYVRVDDASPAEIDRALDGSDFIILDMPRQDDQALVEHAAGERIRARKVPTLSVMTYSPPRTVAGAGLDVDTVRALYDYYVNGTPANVSRMLQFITRRVLRREGGEVQPPVLLPARGIWHPAADEVFTTPAAYRAWIATRARGTGGEKPPVIGVEIASSYLADGQTGMLEDWVRRIEAAGAIPVLFYRNSRGAASGRRPANTTVGVSSDQASPSPLASIADLLMDDGRPFVDAIINLMFLGSDPDGRRAEYEALGVPALQALAYRDGDLAAYLTDRAGISTYSLPFTLTVAEYVGLIDPMVVSTNEKGELVPIGPHVESMVRKALNLVALQRKPNRDKRLALFVWNTPPGEGNVSASNLNVPRSVEALARRLQATGYAVPGVAERQIVDALAAMLRPAYREDALDALLASGHGATLPVAEYRRWFEALPEQVRAEVESFWGPPEKSPWVTARGGEPVFVIPRFEAGNLLIMPQPLRGERARGEEQKLSHDTKVPLNHFYMATYLWVRQWFRADAIVHFGTHGTQEWTPGKERGLALTDYPNLLVGDVPVVYPYIVDNVAEGLHVKRRGRGVVVSHQTPPFAPAGLSTDLLVISDRLRDYASLDDGPVRRRVEEEILEHAARTNILADLEWNADAARERFDTFRQELHTYMDGLSSSVQPLGLHTLGEAAADEHLASTILQMLGRPLAEALALTPAEAAFAADYKSLAATKPYQFVQRHVIGGLPLEASAGPELRRLVQLGREYLSRLRDMSEMDAVLTALDGGLIKTSVGGDPIRNPDALPTGRNLFGFDPARVPTPAAFEAGRAAVEDLVAEYRRTHGGRAPEKLTFSLWSTETMRHLGMLEGQILAAMGMKPVWDRGGRVTGLEVVPAGELKRPRIDVVISITGLYRDQFPNVMEWLNAAVGKAAAIDEPDNFVRRNTRAVRARLLTGGVGEELADEFSLTRIFGNESGDYGTKLPDATLASDTWDGDEELAALYLSRMSWSYGPNPDRWSTKLTGTNGQIVNAYAEHLRGTSAAVFSRSSNLRGMLDTDHPFEYLGGISLAVRHLDGASPQLYISNMRDPSRATLQTAERFLATDLRTTYQHPGWIAEMKKEGYAGTLALANAVNNFWGWSAMDREVVRDDQWQAFHETYVLDRYKLGLREWFEADNPAALAGIAERMLEAVRKGHWNADERTVRELVRTYADLGARHDLHTANAKLAGYISTQVQGFGFGAGRPSQPAAARAGAPPSAASAGRSNPVVRGRHLRPVAVETVVAPFAWSYGALVLLVTLAGLLRQAARQRRFALLEEPSCSRSNR